MGLFLLVLLFGIWMFLIWWTRFSPEGIAKRKAETLKANAEGAKANAEAAKANAEARKKLLNNPVLNTRDWELHAERLQRFGNSKYCNLYYFYGPRGGLYYINRNGHKTYC